MTQLINEKGEPFTPSRPWTPNEKPEPKPIENPEAAKRLVKFNAKDNSYHVLERKHGQTYQVVACDPETFSSLLGVTMIQKGGIYYRTKTKVKKDAFGRPRQVSEVVGVIHVDDKPLEG